MSDISDAIHRKRPLVPLVDEWLSRTPRKENPILKWLLNLYSEKELAEMVSIAIRSYLPKIIKKNQETLELLNTMQGRAFLHENLDALLDYLTSVKYTKQYNCPACRKQFLGKKEACPSCNAGLVWR